MLQTNEKTTTRSRNPAGRALQAAKHYGITLLRDNKKGARLERPLYVDLFVSAAAGYRADKSCKFDCATTNIGSGRITRA